VTTVIVPKVSVNLPLQTVKESLAWNFIKELKLADPSFYKSGRVDMILGADVIDKVILPDIRRGATEQPTAIRTIFGWTITGAYQPQVEQPPSQSISHALVSLSCNDLLKAFWESEESKLATNLFS